MQAEGNEGCASFWFLGWSFLIFLFFLFVQNCDAGIPEDSVSVYYDSSERHTYNYLLVSRIMR